MSEGETFVYGTGNAAKLAFMREALTPLGIRLLGLAEVLETVPEADESGNDPLENARLKAAVYAAALRAAGVEHPVFSCDSGLYIEGLEAARQPGVHIRRVDGRRLDDEEMIAHYAALARSMPDFCVARYRNAICLITGAEVYEHMGADIASLPFLLAKKPHRRREAGFPLNSLSVHIGSGRYYMDLKERPRNVTGEGFRRFFERVMQEHHSKEAVL